MKYTDPSGHYAVCDDGKCEDGSLKPRNPFVISNDEYESLKKDYGKDKGGNFIVDNALNFLYGLRVHKGW